MMLGFQACQSVGRYRDSDADNPTDQLVDYSRRYADGPEETRHASSVKNTQITLPKLNSVVNKPDDELKVFHTEGTPASASYWDLREIGSNEQSSEALVSEEQNRIEHCFSSGHNFPVDTPDTNTENCINSNLVVDEIPAVDETEKTDSNKEEECANQEAEASFSKSSSPLMYSRSSSVDSLNSFEQHSFVDDRSSVSAFSNLASGMISPSEIPDSPFEVASPFISKGKNNEFQFPSNEKSEDPVLIDPPIPNGDYYVDDSIKLFHNEECLSVSNLSALSIQDSTHESISVTQCKNALVSLTQKSSITVNCSVIDGEVDFIEKCQNLEISDEINALEHNCINIMPSHPLDVNQSEKTQSIIETKYEDKGTSTLEDFDFHDSFFEQSLSPLKDKSLKNITVSTPLKKEAEKFINLSGYRVKAYIQQYEGDILQSSDCSKDNSEDESDDLLAECILNGMPSKNDSLFNVSKQSLNHSFQTSGSSLKESFDVPNCSFSDNDVTDDDDDDEEILNECVLLGMPQKSDNLQFETAKSPVLEVLSYSNIITNELPTSNSPNHQLKLLEEMLSQEKQPEQELAEENLNLIVPESVSNHRNFAKEEEFSTYNLISQSNDQLRDIKDDLVKSDDDSDNEESDLLVQQVIQLGMPKSQLRSPKKTKLPVIYPPNKNLGCRDNCPDGVSDGEDDDDDILNEIIQAGKPDSKLETNKSYCAEPTPCLKSQNPRKLTAAEDRQLYLNKYYYGNIIPKVSATQIFVDDNMHFYRTEGSPLSTPARSISDLSTLSFNEDKVCQESFLNNSRNSDCSSESEDDELLRQCIRQGMPGARRVAA